MKKNYLYTIRRNVIFEFISSIELDLRQYIIENNISIDSYNERISERISKDNPSFDYDYYEKNKIHYLDFGDYVQLIAKYLKQNGFNNTIIPELEKLIPIRNRIMHSRPLLVDDDEVVDIFVEKYISVDSVITFSNVKTSMELIKNHQELFFDRTPDFSKFYIKNTIENNLPMVDYDDTGFVGRSEKKKQLWKKINSAYPVISVIGVGGIGKTAMVLSCIYDSIDDDSFPFEKVIWVSLKTKSLQDGEFKDIRNCFKSFADCVEGNELLKKEGVSYIDELLFYMEAYRTLLILDNLETINTDDVKELFENIPGGSKILITSRIGIGEYETRFELGQFDENEAVSYFRKLVKAYEIKVLSKTKDEDVKKYTQKMFYSPLCIKWFVINVGKGNSPDVMANNTEEIIEFCLSNVFDKLSDVAKKVLKIIYINQKNCSLAEIVYLNGEGENAFKNTIQAINELKRCNFIDQVDYGIYNIPEFSNLYLRKKINRFSIDDYEEIEQKINKLNGHLENIRKNPNVTSDYSQNSIFPETNDEKIATIYMLGFIDSSRAKNYKSMDEMFDSATKAAPNFSDLYKVAGYYYRKNRFFDKAKDCFKQAIEHASAANRPYVECYYAKFVLNDLKDVPQALSIINEVVKKKPEEPVFISQQAHILKCNKYHREAADVCLSALNDKCLAVDGFVRKTLIAEYVDSEGRFIDEDVTSESEKCNRYISLLSYINGIDEKYYSIALYKTFYKIVRRCLYIRNNLAFSERILKFFNKYKRLILFVVQKEDLNDFIENVNTYLDANYQLEKDSFYLGLRDVGTIKNYDIHKKVGYIAIKGRNDDLIYFFRDQSIAEQELRAGLRVTFASYFEKGLWKAVNIEPCISSEDD